MTDTLDELRRPLPPEAVLFRLDSKPGAKGARVVPYIDARSVVARLNEICGLDWSDSYQAIQGGVECTLIVSGHPRTDAGEYGTGPQGKGPKAAYSDALKRAATKFGIGAFLYAFPKTLMFVPTEGLRNWKNSKGEDQWDLNAAGLKGLRQKYHDWITQPSQATVFGQILGVELADDTDEPDIGPESPPDGHQQAAPSPAAPDSTPTSSSSPALSEGDTWPEMRDRLRGLKAVDLSDTWFAEVGLTGVVMNAANWLKLDPAKQKACIEAAENLLNPPLPVG